MRQTVGDIVNLGGVADLRGAIAVFEKNDRGLDSEDDQEQEEMPAKLHAALQGPIAEDMARSRREFERSPIRHGKSTD
jgi:hypothetical protein